MANHTPPARVPADSGQGTQKPPTAANSELSETHARVVLDDEKIRRALMRIAHEILESTSEVESLYLVAIPNGGVPLGRRLVENIESLSGIRPGMGILDTTLYRDDLTTRGMRPRLRKTEMPSSVDDRLVILVEDVVNTGRTIRAAMDALMDFGRPRTVRVVALVDRGRRELPIKIDYAGKNIPTQSGETVVLQIGEEVSEAGDPVESLEVVVRTQRTAGDASAVKEGQS